VSARDLVIVGTGGTSVDILDAVHAVNTLADGPAFRPVCFLDDNAARFGTMLHGLPVRGPLESAAEMAGCLFINGIGSPNNFWRRDGFVRRLGIPDDRFAIVVHPTASVSPWATVGAGTAILQHVTVSANAQVGAHVVVLPQTVISHDCLIGDHVCITGGVSLSGAVRVGARSYIGTNACVMNGVTIHEGSLVGMGSVVLRDVAAGSVVVGNPARLLRPVRPETR
jgi:sugar O-acyltransferase (sialic acid O-acetyltransferase NeuD family)